MIILPQSALGLTIALCLSFLTKPTAVAVGSILIDPTTDHSSLSINLQSLCKGYRSSRPNFITTEMARQSSPTILSRRAQKRSKNSFQPTREAYSISRPSSPSLESGRPQPVSSSMKKTEARIREENGGQRRSKNRSELDFPSLSRLPPSVFLDPFFPSQPCQPQEKKRRLQKMVVVPIVLPSPSDILLI